MHAIDINKLIRIRRAAIPPRGAQKRCIVRGRHVEIAGSEAGKRRAILHPVALRQKKAAHVHRAARAGGDVTARPDTARPDQEGTVAAGDACVQNHVIVGAKGQSVGGSPVDRIRNGDVALLRAGEIGIARQHRDVGCGQIAFQYVHRQDCIIEKRGKFRSFFFDTRRVLPRDGHVVRVQEQRAGRPLRRACIHTAVEGEALLARHLDKAAVSSRCAAACGNRAAKRGVPIGPQNNPSPLPCRPGVGGDARAAVHGKAIRARQRIAPLKRAADMDAPAIRIAIGRDLRPLQRYGAPGDGDVAAGPGLRTQRFVNRGGRPRCHPPGDAHSAALPAAEHDRAAAPRHRPRLGHARQVDRIARGIPRRRGLHLDQPAHGRNRA